MAELGGLNISCGVHQLSQLMPDLYKYRAEEKVNDPDAIVRQVYDHRGGEKWTAFIIFSDQSSGPGARVARFIVDNGLGELTATKSKLNPNSHNMITVWIWDINWNALKSYCKKEAKVDQKV